MIKTLKIFVVLSILLLNCKTQSNEEKITSIGNDVINAIENKDVGMFLKILPDDLDMISKDSEMIEYDIKVFNKIFSTYFSNNKPTIVVTDLYNYLGQRLVRIPIYNNKEDSIKNSDLYLGHVTRLSIDLYFGPPGIMPLNKISGYMLVMDEDEQYINKFKPLSFWKKNKKTH